MPVFGYKQRVQMVFHARKASREVDSIVLSMVKHTHKIILLLHYIYPISDEKLYIDSLTTLGTQATARLGLGHIAYRT